MVKVNTLSNPQDILNNKQLVLYLDTYMTSFMVPLTPPSMLLPDNSP